MPVASIAFGPSDVRRKDAIDEVHASMQSSRSRLIARPVSGSIANTSSGEESIMRTFPGRSAGANKSKSAGGRGAMLRLQFRGPEGTAGMIREHQELIELALAWDSDKPPTRRVERRRSFLVVDDLFALVINLLPVVDDRVGVGALGERECL